MGRSGGRTAWGACRLKLQTGFQAGITHKQICHHDSAHLSGCNDRSLRGPAASPLSQGICMGALSMCQIW
jgi:hypothetical protein